MSNCWAIDYQNLWACIGLSLKAGYLKMEAKDPGLRSLTVSLYPKNFWGTGYWSGLLKSKNRLKHKINAFMLKR